MNHAKGLEILRKKAELMVGKNDFDHDRMPEEVVQQLHKELSIHQIELELQNEDLMQTQLDLVESRNNYAELYDFAPVGYFTLDTNGLIIKANHLGANLLGINKNILSKKCFSKYIAPDYQYIFSDFRQRVANSNAVQSCELKLLRKNGPFFYAQLEGKTIINSATKNKNLLLIVTDVTMRKKAQEQYQIANADRLNSMGELAAAIAHELNHPHAVISNYIHGCISRLQKGNYQINEILHAMKQAAFQLNRASEIILRMKNFVCKGQLNYELVDIDEIIKETLTFIKYEIGDYPIAFHYQPIAVATQLLIDKIHIQQVILNLARNAVEAMKDAKTSEPKLTISVRQINKNTIEVMVQDNGPGLEIDNIHKLFNPHFTTKPYGLGLGLAVSRAIIESHQGELSVEPNFPRGSCFKFNLPLKPQNISSL